MHPGTAVDFLTNGLDPVHCYCTVAHGPWGYLYPKPFVQSDHVRGQYVRLPHTPVSTDIVSNGNLIR